MKPLFQGQECPPLRTTLKVSCPACGQQGQVTWAKAYKPGYPDKPQLIELSAGFVAVEVSAKESLRVLCAVCRVSVETR